jgi:hypothetical protein
MGTLVLLLILAIGLLSEPVMAGSWVPIDSQLTRTTYIDVAGAKRIGSVTTTWVLIDHNAIQKEAGDSYLSSKGMWEINCKANTGRQTYHVIYPGHMGSGGTIWSGSLNRQFQLIVPGSIGQLIYEVLCL